MKNKQTPEQFIYYMGSPFAIGTLWQNNIGKTMLIYIGKLSNMPFGIFQFYCLHEKRIIEIDERSIKHHYIRNDIERIL